MSCPPPPPPTGAYAEVYVALKEDTRALFAVKLCRPARVRKKRAETHLRMERRALAQAATASPFLCPLRYAFTCGPYVALVLPFYAGGTLGVQIEERAKPRGGLPILEVRWLGAQIVLALEALHRIGILHRDVKPNVCTLAAQSNMGPSDAPSDGLTSTVRALRGQNVMLTADGYAVLADFGLSDEPGVSGRAGTRGYVRASHVDALAPKRIARTHAALKRASAIALTASWIGSSRCVWGRSALRSCCAMLRHAAPCCAMLHVRAAVGAGGGPQGAARPSR